MIFQSESLALPLLTKKKGWVGTNKTGFETIDGGKKWIKKSIGAAVNKIRVIKTPGGSTCYAIGSNVYKWEDKF